jgi:hypothetical protein
VQVRWNLNTMLQRKEKVNTNGSRIMYRRYQFKSNYLLSRII